MTNWYKKAQINGKEPWQTTWQDFIDYHYTGGIRENAYDQYKTVEGLDWIRKEKYPELYDVKDFGGYRIEFRKSGELLQYVKHDEEGNIARDERGSAIMQAQQEMIDKKLPLVDQTIAAFVGDDAIGWASNEFGSSGVWVVEHYQKMGIGGYLLKEFRKTMKPESKIGQMTQAGRNLIKSYHKNLVQEALNEGKNIPQEVLNDYPELQNLQGLQNTNELV